MELNEDTKINADRINYKHFVVKIAGLNIEINTLSPGTLGYCIDYLSAEKPNICICVTEQDLKSEIDNKKSHKRYINEPYLETIAVYRKIVESVLEFDIMLFHGAVIAINNQAIMFSGASGVGKTTHIVKWLKEIDCAYVINGDKPLVKITDKDAIACGTPWSGKERFNTNTMVPLKDIVFLERNNENQIIKMSFADAYPYIIKQTYLPNDVKKAKKTLSLISGLNQKVSFWLFKCNNLKEDCFSVAYNSLILNKM